MSPHAALDERPRTVTRIPAPSRAEGALARSLAHSWRPVVFALVAFALWWTTTATGLLPPYLVPSPAETWSAFVGNLAYFGSNTWVTVLETLIGFAIAVVVGEAVAIAMVYSPSLERTIYQSAVLHPCEKRTALLRRDLALQTPHVFIHGFEETH